MSCQNKISGCCTPLPPPCDCCKPPCPPPYPPSPHPHPCDCCKPPCPPPKPPCPPPKPPCPPPKPSENDEMIDACPPNPHPHPPCPPKPCECCKPRPPHCRCRLHPCICIPQCSTPGYPSSYYGYTSLNLRRYENQIAYSNVCYPSPFISPFI